MSKGSKRNKDSEISASNGESDDEFEKDFKTKRKSTSGSSKKSKKEDSNDLNEHTEKKLRDRRSGRVDPFEKEIKKAIEMSLKENKTSSKPVVIEDKVSNLVDDAEDDFVCKSSKENFSLTKQESETSSKSTEDDSVPHKAKKKTAVIESDTDNDKPVEDEVIAKHENIAEEEEFINKAQKHQAEPSKNSKKKLRKNDNEEFTQSENDSEEEFKKSKPKKKTPPKKKATPNSNKNKKKASPPVDQSESSSTLNEQETIQIVNEKPKERVSVALNFDIEKPNPISRQSSTSSSKSSEASSRLNKSLSAFEPVNTKKNDRILSDLNSSLNKSSPLGRIEIKTPQPYYRVGLSRNSRVKPLHPNAKPI